MYILKYTESIGSNMTIPVVGTTLMSYMCCYVLRAWKIMWKFSSTKIYINGFYWLDPASWVLVWF